MLTTLMTPTAAMRALATALALSLAACGKNGAADAAPPKSADAASPGATRTVACTLMPLAEINAITGGAYTKAEGNDDGHSSESGCQYTTETDPAGVTLNVTWIDAHDYSSPAEHLAMQKASLGGAALGGKLAAQSAGGASVKGIPSGHFTGVGEDAVQTMTLLTARKGDYTVMVQIFPQDMMKLLQDSTYATALWEKEKTIANTALGKL